MSSPTDPGADYRHAKEAVGVHRRAQATAELDRLAWLKAHRTIPTHVLFDAETGVPLDPKLKLLTAQVDQAATDVAWCRALVVACGEVVKGCTFAEATT